MQQSYTLFFTIKLIRGKHVWHTTHVLYKAALKNRFKGIGSGIGDSILFEGWSDGKLESYNIDPDTYNHTIIAYGKGILFAARPLPRRNLFVG